MSSNFIHVVTNDRVFFYFKAEQYSTICIYSYVFHDMCFLYPFVDSYLSCFHNLAVMNNALTKTYIASLQMAHLQLENLISLILICRMGNNATQISDSAQWQD